jgi:ComF family protein
MDCTRRLTPVAPMCYRCRELTDSGKTCPTCRAHSDLFAVRAVAVYQGVAKDLVWQLKFKGAQAAATEIAATMARFAPHSPEYVLVPASTATSRVRQRGFDQATLIARELARKTGLPFSRALRRSGQHHQVGANRAQRLIQLQHAYRVVATHTVQGKHVILIDDVLTTGATLEAAAKALKAAGAKRVSALVFARA